MIRVTQRSPNKQLHGRGTFELLVSREIGQVRSSTHLDGFRVYQDL